MSMSDTLIGVLIGGVIGSFAPLTTLFFNHLHWKRDAKLTYLKQERQRLEELFEKNLKLFSEALAKDMFSFEMTADIMVLMPKEIFEIYDKYLLNKDRSEKAKKSAYSDMAVAMKKALAEVDNRINEMVS